MTKAIVLYDIKSEERPREGKRHQREKMGTREKEAGGDGDE